MAIAEAGAIRRRSHSWPVAQRRTAGTVFLGPARVAREEWAKPRGRKSDPAVAAKAIEALNGTDMGGRSLTVNEAKPREPRGGGGGGGYRGGGGGGGYGGGGGGGGRW